MTTTFLPCYCCLLCLIALPRLPCRQQKVDVTITTLRSGVVRVEDSEESLYASIDLVCDKVSRKLRKVKERLISQGAWPGKGGPRLNTEEEEFKVWGLGWKGCS
jgi:ribosome-associated translation inhibitor RaiA